LIIAAGRGSRLARRSPLKPLVPVAGTPLIERIMVLVAGRGIREFLVVGGYRSGDLERFVGDVAARRNLAATVLYNPEWQRENGYSVLAAQGALQGDFIMLMADHLFDGRLLDSLLGFPVGAGQVALVVDHRVTGHPHVDLGDVTKVQVRDGRIVDIGKRLAAYNAFDTGIFRCTPALFSGLEESVRRGDGSLSGGVRVLAGMGDALAVDSGGRFWIDIDDERALNLAEDYYANDGPHVPDDAS
jgi:1L-myo-inositol 1-phosphate cytidylyltransferase